MIRWQALATLSQIVEIVTQTLLNILSNIIVKKKQQLNSFVFTLGHHSFWAPTHQHAIKEVSKLVNHDRMNY